MTHEPLMDVISEKKFCDLMDLPPGAREAALEASAELSSEQKDFIRQMLADAVAAEAYFTGSPDAVRELRGRSVTEVLGDMCGPYKLVRKLGEGGFGVVWQAEQDKPLRRTVALKVIKAGMDSNEVLARFDAERQALARMDHPNIAKVLDAGQTESGRPYFAMELVEGRPITRFCEEEELDTSQRLRLFMDVCAALNHAHQKGVIHRDIKPSNVMVTRIESRAQVKVIDFGIAKAVEGKLSDHTLHTRVEQWIGTPAYMSPEQAGLASGDLDTRSDIYALGVILYELITGGPPFDPKTLMRAGYEEMRRIIREEDPPRPSVRITTQRQPAENGSSEPDSASSGSIRAIKSELDWIIMKAIDKSKERRYGTAAALAEDVGRFLADEPIAARPPTSVYLIAKFARRHRAAVQSLLAFAIILVAAVVFSSWQALRARNAERLAENRLREAVLERNGKDAALQDAQAVSRLLSEVFRRPDPNVDGRKVTVIEALNAASAKIDEELKDQPERQAMLMEVLAGTYDGLALYEKSLVLREQILSIRRIGTKPPHLDVLAALRKLVENAEKAGRFDQVISLAEEERAHFKNGGKDSVLPYAAALRSLARAHFRQGEQRQAVEVQKSLLEHTLESSGSLSEEASLARWELDQYSYALADQQEDSTEEDAAGKTGKKPVLPQTSAILKVREIWQAAVRLHGPEDEQTLVAHRDYALALWEQGHSEQAISDMTRAQNSAQRARGRLDPLSMEIQGRLARMLHSCNMAVEAVRVQKQLVENLRELKGEAASATISAESSLERFYFYSPLGEEYREFLHKALERRNRTLGEDHYYTSLIHQSLVMQFYFQRRFEEGLVHAQHAVPVMKRTLGPRHRTTANAMGNMGRCLAALGRTHEATEILKEACPNMRDDTYMNLLLANLQVWTGDLEGYNATRRWMIEYIVENRDSFSSQAYILERAVWNCCLTPLENEEQAGELLATLEKARQIRESPHEAPRRHSPDQIAMKRVFALYRCADYAGVLEEFDQIQQLLNPKPEEGGILNPPPSAVFFIKAMALKRTNKNEEALGAFREGESLLPKEQPDEVPLKGVNTADGSVLTPWIIHREAQAMFK